jgi:hypothetical protein
MPFIGGIGRIGRHIAEPPCQDRSVRRGVGIGLHQPLPHLQQFLIEQRPGGGPFRRGRREWTRIGFLLLNARPGAAAIEQQQYGRDGRHEGGQAQVNADALRRGERRPAQGVGQSRRSRVLQERLQRQLQLLPVAHNGWIDLRGMDDEATWKQSHEKDQDRRSHFATVEWTVVVSVLPISSTSKTERPKSCIRCGPRRPRPIGQHHDDETMRRFWMGADRRMSRLWVFWTTSVAFALLAPTAVSLLSVGKPRPVLVAPRALDHGRKSRKWNVVLFAKKKTIKQPVASETIVEVTNAVTIESVTPASNAWETMQLWKKEILVDSLLSSKFDKEVSKLFEETKVKTVQQIKNKSTDDKNWLGSLAACGVNTVFLLEKLDKVIIAKSDTRMVPVDYKIAASGLSHTIDLEELLNRVEETFAWYNRTEEPPTFVAPYFPIIQSSGMGKTKLLYELSYALNNRKDTSCYLCLSGAIDIAQDDRTTLTNATKVFSHTLDFRNVVADRSGNPNRTMAAQAREAAENVMQYLDKIFLSCSTKRLVLLFDEAQVLLTKNF